MAKQVMDVQMGKGMSRGQSNEHLRNFTKNAFEEKRTHNFDPTREHLNFEVMPGGVIAPVHSHLPIDVRISQNLAERGIKDPNEGLAEDDPKRRNTIVNFIFQGSRDQMRKLAFGDQYLDENDMDHVADNRDLQRMPEIELWAKDIYEFAAKKFGEKNIAAFVVHLDEKNPHVHCTVIPTGIIKGKERISARSVFGHDKFEASRIMTNLHDELAVVNAKWGLDRGDDVSVTGAKHRTTEEYWKWLGEQCSQLEQKKGGLEKEVTLLNSEYQKAEKRVKGLTTMTENLENKMLNIQADIAELENDRENASTDKEKVEAELTRLRFQLSETEQQLADKKTKLQDAVTALDELAGKRASVTNELEMLERQKTMEKRTIGEITMQRVNALAWDAASTEMSMIEDHMQQMRQSLPLGDREFFDRIHNEMYKDTILEDMAERANEITAIAASLFLGYVDAATQFAQTHGGGGGGSSQGWRKKDDEDDRAYMGRCFLQARQMLRPQKRSRGKGLGR